VPPWNTHVSDYPGKDNGSFGDAEELPITPEDQSHSRCRVYGADGCVYMRSTSVAEEQTVLVDGPWHCDRETPDRVPTSHIPNSSSLNPSKLLAGYAYYSSALPQMRFAGPWGNRQHTSTKGEDVM
jgi:hypothetical protein